MMAQTVNAIPDFRVTLDGKDISDRLRPRLVSLSLSLSLSEKRGGDADQLTVAIDHADSRAPLPPIGATLQVSLGWEQGSDVQVGLVDKGSFIIDEIAHEGPPDTITLTARAADFTGKLKQRREASWRGTTLGALVREIAGRHGLKASCAAKLAAIAVPAKAQSRESDLAFLRHLGREHDAVATIKRGTLILSPIGAGVTPGGKPLPAVTIARRDGDAHRFRIAKRDDVTGVTASWHDRKGAKKHEVTNGEKDGAKRLARTYASEAEAKRAARAERSRAARQPRSLSRSPTAAPTWMPETKAKVTGYKNEIDATVWLIAEVTQSLADQGYTTGLKLESAWRSPPTQEGRRPPWRATACRFA